MFKSLLVWNSAPDTGCTFFHMNLLRNCNVCWKISKINKKGPGMAQKH